MTSTQRLGLPFLSEGQSQKEASHNEALQVLDTIVGLAVEEGPRSDPPASPSVGSSYLVADAPTGVWAGKAGVVAAFTVGGWRFHAPQEGMIAYVRSASVWAAYRAASWELGYVRCAAVVVDGQQVVGARAGPVASPAGGSTIDAPARSAIDQILLALRGHGLIAT